MAGEIIKLSTFNEFCTEHKEGDILLNLSTNNLWGKYLLVTAKSLLCADSVRVGYLMLMSLERSPSGELKPTGKRVDLTFDKANNINYLKKVGFCRYSITPTIVECKTNFNLVKRYQGMNMAKFSAKQKSRKAYRKKWGLDGEKIIKETNNFTTNENQG